MKINSDKIVQYGVGAFGGGFLGLFYLVLLSAAFDSVGYVLKFEWSMLNNLENMPFLLGFAAAVGAYHVGFDAGVKKGGSAILAAQREHQEYLRQTQGK